MKRQTLFTQMGEAGTKIARILCDDNELCRLLKYSVEDPFDEKLPNPTKEEILNHNIRERPLVRADELTESFIVLNWEKADILNNTDAAFVVFTLDIFCNFDTWKINDLCQRPFKIMDQIMGNVNNLRLTGLGQLKFTGFELTMVSNEYSLHKMSFVIDALNSNETLH